MAVYVYTHQSLCVRKIKQTSFECLARCKQGHTFSVALAKTYRHFAADTNSAIGAISHPNVVVEGIIGNLVVLPFLLDFFTYVYCITTPD